MDPTAPPSEGAPAGGSSRPARTPWPQELAGALRATGQWAARPRVRLCLIGVLLLAGGMFVGNAFWTLPLVVIGALMVVVAWVGHRLEGRIVVEWGERGTELALRATVKPPAPAPQLTDEAGAGGRRLTLAAEPGAGGGRLTPGAEVIEGEAHTVEIDVADLKALLAAVESADPATGSAGVGSGEAAHTAQPAGASEAAEGGADKLTDIRIRRAVHRARTPGTS